MKLGKPKTVKKLLEVFKKFFVTSSKEVMVQRVALVILVVSVATLAVYVLQRDARKRPASVEEAFASAASSLAEKDYDSAIETLEDTRKATGSEDTKYQATLALATVLFEKEDYEGALELYKEAISIKDTKATVDAYLGAASAAELLEDKQLAADYYQKALEFYRQEVAQNPDLQANIDSLQNHIGELRK